MSLEQTCEKCQGKNLITIDAWTEKFEDKNGVTTYFGTLVKVYKIQCWNCKNITLELEKIDI